VLVALTPLARERAGVIRGPLADLQTALARYTVEELTLLRDFGQRWAGVQRAARRRGARAELKLTRYVSAPKRRP